MTLIGGNSGGNARVNAENQHACNALEAAPQRLEEPVLRWRGLPMLSLAAGAGRVPPPFASQIARRGDGGGKNARPSPSPGTPRASSDFFLSRFSRHG
jgi:hypothetical protein